MNYQQSNNLLDRVEPGSRITRVVGRVRQNSPDMSQGESVVPDNPGPRMTGRTPIVGKLRRDRDLPVLRDQLPELTDN